MILNKKLLSKELTKRVKEGTSKNNRTVVAEKILDRMFSDIGESKISRFELWFRLKPYWWFRDVKYWFRRQHQKWTTGFPHEESSDFRYACGNFVVPRLKHMKANLSGYPSYLLSDEKWEKITAEKKSHPLAAGRNVIEVKRDEYGIQEWNKILDKIIWSFENHDNDPSPTMPENYDPRCKMITYDDGVVEYECLDDRPWDWTVCEAHDKKVEEGLDLFAKHYKNLWC